MLRNVVLVIALACLGGGMLGVLAGGPGFWGLLIWGVIFTLGTLYERVRYKQLATAAPGAGWERTNERFVDEETGKMVTVYIEKKTGERQYVTE